MNQPPSSPSSSSAKEGAQQQQHQQPIIFLDIDGVLNRTKHATHIRFDDDLVERLKYLVLETNAVIVLSTFWRHYKDYIAYVLDRYGIASGRIIGATPGYNKSMIGRTATDTTEYTSRAQEIRSWLLQNNNNNPQQNFVILDDRISAIDDTPFLQNRFVHCQTHMGLTNQDVDKAIEILMIGKHQEDGEDGS